MAYGRLEKYYKEYASLLSRHLLRTQIMTIFIRKERFKKVDDEVKIALALRTFCFW